MPKVYVRTIGGRHKHFLAVTPSGVVDIGCAGTMAGEICVAGHFSGNVRELPELADETALQAWEDYQARWAAIEQLAEMAS